LSLAEATERGAGQSPWLFKLCVDDLVGTKESSGPFAGTGFLSSEQVAVARSITAPVLNTWRDKSGRLREAPGAPTTIKPEEALDSGDADAPFCTTLCESCPSVRTALLSEFCLRLCWYGRTKGFDDFLKDACAPIGFEFEITGALGIKRQYQVQQIAQMVVKASSTVQQVKAEAGTKGIEKIEEAAPTNFSLLQCDDMTDVLDRPKLLTTDAEELAKLETPLTAAEALILLTRCNFLWTTGNPSDELLLTYIHALADRVLVTFKKPEETEDGQMSTANWLTFSCGLFYRCRAEHHRNKTRERATFQLQALVDQFNDEKPCPAHRLLNVHGAGYPARFHLSREMAMRMMRMGMVSTAFDHLKRLRMWPDAIDCLMIADRKVECLEMVHGLLETNPSPRLWCALGDIEAERDVECYTKAWDLSGHRYARAQRSLGRIHFKKGRLADAVDCFLTAVQINPLHSNIWFTCGVAQMKLERWDDAAMSLSRCCGVDEDNSEAWANLGAVHNERGDLKQARACFYEATRRARESWRMWESFMGICMKLRDIQGVINCVKRIVELGMACRVPEKILGILTMSVISDAEGLYQGARGSDFSKKLLEFFVFATDKSASEPAYWRFLAEMQLHHNKPAEALESRLKQSRASQARLWVEADAEVFGKGISELIECLVAVAESLDDPNLVEQARPQLQSFAYLVRNAEKQLKIKLDACPTVPEAWSDAHAKLSALATSAEDKGAKAGLVAADAA